MPRRSRATGNGGEMTDGLERAYVAAAIRRYACQELGGKEAVSEGPKYTAVVTSARCQWRGHSLLTLTRAFARAFRAPYEHPGSSIPLPCLLIRTSLCPPEVALGPTRSARSADLPDVRAHTCAARMGRTRRLLLRFSHHPLTLLNTRCRSKRSERQFVVTSGLLPNCCPV